MSNHYTNYYMTQAGNGIDLYRGYRSQKGNGFFGRFVSNALLPLVRTVAPIALEGARSLLKNNDIDNLKKAKRRKRIQKKRVKEYF